MTDVYAGMSPSHDAPANAGHVEATTLAVNVMTPAPEVRPTEKVEPFKFTGEAGEYFRIWVAEEARESRCG